MNQIHETQDRLVINSDTHQQDIPALDALRKMRDQSAGWDSEKNDWTVTPGNVEVADDGSLTAIEPNFMGAGLSARSGAMRLTDHSLGQMLYRLSPTLFGKGTTNSIHKATFQAMQERFPQHFAENIRWLLGETEADKQFLFRQMGDRARAVLSDKYATLNNTDLLDTVLGALEAQAEAMPELHVVRSSVSPDEMAVRIVFRNDDKDGGQGQDFRYYGEDRTPDTRGGNGGNYGLGVAIINDEIGRGAVKVLPLIWRHSCRNSIMDAANTDAVVNLRHMGNATALRLQVNTAILTALTFSSNLLETVYQAEIEQLPSIASVLRGIAKQHGLSQKVTDLAMVGTEGQHTRMGVVNGLTYAAHRGELSFADELELELLGGAVLRAPQTVLAGYAGQSGDTDMSARSWMTAYREMHNR